MRLLLGTLLVVSGIASGCDGGEEQPVVVVDKVCSGASNVKPPTLSHCYGSEPNKNNYR